MTDEKQDAAIKQRAAEIATSSFPGGQVSVGWMTALVERALREGMAMNERDAARYRWLREQPKNITPPHIDVVFWVAADESCNDGTELRSEELDAAIDAAMLARNGE